MITSREHYTGRLFTITDPIDLSKLSLTPDTLPRKE